MYLSLKFKDILIGLLLALSLYTSYHAYKWKKVADLRGWQAEEAFNYLSQPITTLNGQPISRGAVLDALATQAASQVKK